MPPVPMPLLPPEFELSAPFADVGDGVREAGDEDGGGANRITGGGGGGGDDFGVEFEGDGFG